MSDREGREAGTPDTSVVEARAKLNLFLRVLGARADGFHEVETAILPISLADRLEIHAYADPGEFRTLSLSLEVTGDASLTRLVPRDESNLVLRAATALGERTGARGFADIVLTKRVPAAAGMGGGSADAAATLKALNDLWGCGLKSDELVEVGADVGSDVPALMVGGPALARGRGERVDPVTVRPFRWLVETFPFPVRTADAFRWWEEDGGATGPDPAALMEAAREGDTEAAGGLMYNDLEVPVLRRHPAVREARDRLLSAGASGVVMCGSGPTLAALIPGQNEVSSSRGVEVWSAGTASS
ncbi:MAG: 4-(cytidine 5'-diphospho)-2-C-methyl-D-erythritol kinase [Actinomycetota bacterium]